MISSLVSCAGCCRHIRRIEATCPFCGVVVTSDVAGAPERAWPSVRLSRAALMVFATTVGTTACSGKVMSDTGMSSDVPPGDASVGGGAGRPGTGGALGSGGAGGAMNWAVFYGAPMFTGGTTSASGGTSNSGGANAGTTVTHYGAPSFAPDGGDAGPASGGDAGPDGGTAGAAGKPPPGE